MKKRLHTSSLAQNFCTFCTFCAYIFLCLPSILFNCIGIDPLMFEPMLSLRFNALCHKLKNNKMQVCGFSATAAALWCGRYSRLCSLVCYCERTRWTETWRTTWTCDRSQITATFGGRKWMKGNVKSTVNWSMQRTQADNHRQTTHVWPSTAARQMRWHKEQMDRWVISGTEGMEVLQRKRGEKEKRNRRRRKVTPAKRS